MCRISIAYCQRKVKNLVTKKEDKSLWTSGSRNMLKCHQKDRQVFRNRRRFSHTCFSWGPFLLEIMTAIALARGTLPCPRYWCGRALLPHVPPQRRFLCEGPGDVTAPRGLLSWRFHLLARRVCVHSLVVPSWEGGAGDTQGKKEERLEAEAAKEGQMPTTPRTTYPQYTTHTHRAGGGQACRAPGRNATMPCWVWRGKGKGGKGRQGWRGDGSCWCLTLRQHSQ